MTQLLTGNPFTNSATITYPNNPYTDGSGTTSTTPGNDAKVYSYQLQLSKVGPNGQGGTEALTGAEFTLTTGEGTSATTVAKAMVGDDGKLTIIGLEAGKTYTLTESVVPQGMKSIDPIKFTITAVKGTNGDTIEGFTLDESSDASGAATWTIGSTSVAAPDGETGTGLTIPVTITNAAGSDLPLTGQAGIVAGVVIGGVIIAISAVALVRNRKRDENAA